MINPDHKSKNVSYIPQRNDLRSKAGVVQQYQWSYEIGGYGWFEVPEVKLEDSKRFVGMKE